MSWHRDRSRGERAYGYAKAYSEAQGGLNPPAGYRDADGFPLGAWVSEQRKKHAEGRLKPVQIRRLEALGITWDVTEEAWQRGLEHARAYYGEHGHLDVKGSYQAKDGYRLGIWIWNQRTRYREGKLTGERIRMLEELGMVWNVQADRWNRGYSFAKAYRRNGGQVPVLLSYVTAEGYPLGEWLRSQEQRYKKGVLEADRIERLAEIGIVFDTT